MMPKIPLRQITLPCVGCRVPLVVWVIPGEATAMCWACCREGTVMSPKPTEAQLLRQATMEEMEQVVADHYGVDREYAAGMAEEFGPGWVQREFSRIRGLLRSRNQRSDLGSRP